jgi:polar amino acid transport system substrate-binding protein
MGTRRLVVACLICVLVATACASPSADRATKEALETVVAQLTGVPQSGQVTMEAPSVQGTGLVSVASPVAPESVTPMPLQSSEGMTWLAREVIPVGEPYEGRQEYYVGLAYQNRTGTAVDDRLSICRSGFLGEVPAILTEDGQVLAWEPDSRQPSCISTDTCGSPSYNTGLVPPGFGIRGKVLYNLVTKQPCVSEMGLQFSTQQALQPKTVTGPEGVVIPLDGRGGDSVYGPLDPAQTFERLPAQVRMGRVLVTIQDVERAGPAGMVIHLAYENTDATTSAPVCDPIATVIDSDGYASAPLGIASPQGIAGDWRAQYAEACGIELPSTPIQAIPSQLGPLQKAEGQTCVFVNPNGNEGLRYFVVACGWSEEEDNGRTSCSVASEGFTSIDLTNSGGGRECQVYEVSTGSALEAVAQPVPTVVAQVPTVAPGLPTAAPAATGKDLLDQVMEAGKLVVSTDPNYAPQSFINDQGELDGFDVNVAQEVAKRLGVRLEFVAPDWDLITGGNWGGRWDVSIGSMTPTEPRAQVLWFTNPYYYTPASFAVYKDNTTIKTVEDLVGKTVGLGTATTYEDYLNGKLSIMGGEIMYDPPSGIEVKAYTTDAEAIDDLTLGDGVRVDAVMSAQPTIQRAIEDGAPIKFVGTPAFYEPLVFALDRSRGRSDAMLAGLNEIIQDMRDDGTLTELSMEWYGIDITSSPIEPQEELRQWAFSAQVSSQRGDPGWSAIQATGMPNTLQCGDFDTAWASASGGGVDWLEVTYSLPVRPSQVRIVQSFGPNQVVKVEVRDTAGTYHTIYSGQPQAQAQCPYTLSIPVEGTDYGVVGIKITVDQSAMGGWNQIDAVELVGSAVP